MTKLIELNTDPNILISSTIVNYDRPDFVYFPIEKNSTLFVKQNDIVKIGTPIMKNYEEEVLSSVSGIVRKIGKVNTIKGIMDAIWVENDYQDQRLKNTHYKRNINHIYKEELDLLFQQKKIFFENKKNFILNCIDDEPYVASESFYLFYYMDDFLQLLDHIAKVYNYKKVIIAVKSGNSKNINDLMNQLGMYPNITLMMLPNFYLLGKSKFLLEHLYLKEEESIVVSASTFSEITDLLISNKTKTNHYITISGNHISNPLVVNARIGTKLKDVVNSFISLKNNSIFIINGLMSGKVIQLDDFIITKDLFSLLIMKKQEEIKNEACIHCGACIDICPMHLNPKLLYKEKYYNQCIKCGLCSYICPSYINFNNIKGDLND